MTSPTSAGSVSVEVLADARALAKSMKAEVEKAFKNLDVSKAIQDSVGDTTVKLKVDPQVDLNALAAKIREASASVSVPLNPDVDGLAEKVKKARVPKVPVPLDPLLQAFQQEVRRQTAALARTVNVKVPVEADGGKLRAELGTQLAAIQAQSRIKIPTEPADKAAYEARLKAQLAEVSARVKQSVKVDVKVDDKGTKSLGSSLKNLPTSGVGLLRSAFSTLSQAMAESSNVAIRFGGSLVGSLSTAAGPLGAVAAGFAVLVGGIGAVAAAASVAIPAISALAGAVAALPGILAGAGAGFGALSLGFKGISDAFKPKAGGGGGGGGGEDPASRARRIAGAERGVEAARRGIASATRALQSANRGLEAAERGVAEAQERVADAQARAQKAQLAINRARKEAKEDIEDLNRALSGAKLDEEDATLRVTEALRELNKAKESGILPDISRADLEYRQAQQALEEAKDSTEDLGEAAADANKKGVEGSDKVQDALQDQTDANRAVKDAIQGVADAQNSVLEAQNGVLSANDALKSSYDGLASAQDSLAEAQKKAATAGGGAGGLKDIVKLAPEAQKFVNAIKALKPAFESLRLDVQNRLFKDLDDTVRQVGTAWLPALRTTLGSYADTFNTFFRNLGTSISQPKFITDLQAGAESSRKALADIGTSVTTSLVPAFGALSKAAGPFIEQLGKELAGVVTEFSNWILKAEDSGALTKFFDDAKEALHDIFTTGKEVGKIIGNIFTILTNGNGKKDKSAIDSFNDGLKSINKYLEDPANQAKIADFIGEIKTFLTDLKTSFEDVKGLLDKLFPESEKQSAKDSASTLGSDIGKALFAGVLAGVGAAIEANFTSFGPLLWEGDNSLIGRIKRGLGIQSPSTLTIEMGKELINGLIQGIGEKVEELKNKAAELPGKIRDGIGNATTFLTQKGKDFATGLRNGMTSAKETVKAKAGELKTKAGEAFSNAGTFLTGKGQQIANSLRSGMQSVSRNVGITASNLKITAQNAFTNAGTLLRNIGASITNGLINGIASRAAALGGYLNQIGAYIKANKGPIEKDRKLLIPEGQAIMDGLIGGIASKRDALGAQLSDLTGLVGSTAFSDLGAQADAAITSNLAVASAQKVLLGFEPGFTGDWLQDGLKRNIKFRNNGDVLAGLGSS